GDQTFVVREIIDYILEKQFVGILLFGVPVPSQREGRLIFGVDLIDQPITIGDDQHFGRMGHIGQVYPFTYILWYGPIGKDIGEFPLQEYIHRGRLCTEGCRVWLFFYHLLRDATRCTEYCRERR